MGQPVDCPDDEAAGADRGDLSYEGTIDQVRSDVPDFYLWWVSEKGRPPLPEERELFAMAHAAYEAGASDAGARRALWRSDAAFVDAAARAWPEDLELANRGGYDRGAAQKLTYRHQGWLAARRDGPG